MNINERDRGIYMPWTNAELLQKIKREGNTIDNRYLIGFRLEMLVGGVPNLERFELIRSGTGSNEYGINFFQKFPEDERKDGQNIILSYFHFVEDCCGNKLEKLTGRLLLRIQTYNPKPEEQIMKEISRITDRTSISDTKNIFNWDDIQITRLPEVPYGFIPDIYENYRTYIRENGKLY